MPSRSFESAPDRDHDQDQDVVDARYAHLIEPIRDLASNWNIDLASELEEYLADLDRITVSFDNGHTTLNFAQAALLIQGSACVYSKKVEYLYNLLYQTMDVVIQKRKRQASSVAADGTDLDALTSWSSDEPCLMSLDDHIQPSKNIDLDETDSIDYERERRTSLMMRTPVGMNMNGGTREDKKEEIHFRISQCQVHTSGALLLEERDSLLMDASLKRVAASPLDALPFGTPRALLSPQKGPSASHSSPPLNHVEAPNFDSAAHDDDSDDDNHVDMDMGLDVPMSDMNDGLDMKHVDDTTTVHETRGRKKQVTFATDLVEYDREDEQDDKQAQDPWRTMDPHDAGSTRPRPFRKGRTYREPVSLQKSIAPSHVNDVLHLQPIQQVLLNSISSSSLKVPYFAEFAGVFLTHAQQRKQQYKLVQKQQQKAIRTRQQEAKLGAGIPLSPLDLSLDSTSSTDEADAWAAACAPPDDDDDDDNNAPLDIAGDIQHDVDVDTNQWDSSPVDVASAIPFEAVALDEELASLTKTYQDLCREHVDSYLSSAAAYLSQTQLSKRVLEWQDRLEPILEEESHHPSYDIHEYGEKLVHSIQEAPETVKKAPDVLEFEQAVVGQPRYEICRLFLAALQLANQGNVEILPSQLSNVRDSNVDPALNGSMALHLLRSSRAQPHMHVQPIALSQLSQSQSQSQSQLQSSQTSTETSTSHAPAKKPSRTRAPASKQKQRVLVDDDDVVDEMELSEDSPSPSPDTSKNKKNKAAAADKENVMLRANGRRRQRV